MQKSNIFKLTMEAKKINKIRTIESVVFFIVWIIIFMMGSDFPPPIGFLWIVVILAIVSLGQWIYLKYLLQNICKKPTFVKNVLFFFIISILIYIFTFFVLNHSYPFESMILIVIIVVVGEIHGIIFWLINKLIKKKVIH